jgi:transposase-like protein
MEISGTYVTRRKTQKDYSLAFKLQVVSEVEKGLLTYKEAQRKYCIQGRSTVLVWLRKHGILDWNTNLMKDRKTPQQQISELKKKLKRLEAEKEILNAAIDIADKELKSNIRKKYLPLLSKVVGRTGEDKE